MKPFFAFLILLCCCSVLFAEEINGTVSSVFDGNTFESTLPNQETYTVMLHGIDSPEKGQNYAEQAKKMLEKLLLNKSITVMLKGKDRWGNRLGEVHMDGANDPRQELVKAGFAWTAERDPLPELEALKEEARASGKGLWKEENPTPPWTYRREQTMMQLKSS